MTTNELIEKYGIGHNCLSDAYDLGKAHTLAECENRETEWWDVLFNNHIQTKQDAIQECIQELKKYFDEDSWCIEILEEFKEKNNVR